MSWEESRLYAPSLSTEGTSAHHVIKQTDVVRAVTSVGALGSTGRHFQPRPRFVYPRKWHVY